MDDATLVTYAILLLLSMPAVYLVVDMIRVVRQLRRLHELEQQPPKPRPHP